MNPVAAVLDRLGVRWAVIGAYAALRYRREPRITADLDVLTEHSPGIGPTFRSEGFLVREIADPSEPPHLIVLRRAELRVDLLIAHVDYQQVALERSTDHYITVEDVIVHKLIAWRPRDRDDILSILRADNEIDDRYVERWATEWEVVDRWQAALRSR